jgi:hypothetical protein
MKHSNIYRQGDVLLIPVNSVPAGFKPLRSSQVTLALGEVTGHHHSIYDNATGYVADATEENPQVLAEYVVVESGTADLTHQEHDTISLPPGTYQSIRQSEYAPGALRNVAD